MADGRSVSEIKWRVVMMDKHGNYILRKLVLSSSDKGADVMRKLIAHYRDTQWRRRWLITAVPFKRLVVYTVTLCPVPIEAISNTPCVVYLATEPNHCHLPMNTAQDSESLSNITDIVTGYSPFAVVHEALGNICAREALLIRFEVNKFILLIFVTVSLATAISSGLIVGFLQQSLDTGFGVSSTILGVVGVAEGFLTWLLN